MIRAGLISLLVTLVAADPNSNFSVVFSTNFSEVNLRQQKQTGKWWYSYATLEQRLDRTNSGADRYCTTVHNSNIACTQYVTGGMRYLSWPTLGECCACCTDAQGCGIVKPNWISADNGTYVGQKQVKTDYYSGPVDEWLAYGVQPNYYWAVPGTGAAVALLQVPNDNQYFNPATYSTAPISPSVFALPSASCSTRCKSTLCLTAAA